MKFISKKFNYLIRIDKTHNRYICKLGNFMGKGRSVRRISERLIGSSLMGLYDKAESIDSVKFMLLEWIINDFNRLYI